MSAVRAGARRPVGLLLEPEAAWARARLEQDLLATSLFAPVRATVLARREARDPLRALAARAEELARASRFARGLELVVWSTGGGSALRHAAAMRLATHLAEVPLVVHLADDGLADALEQAPPLAARIARRALRSTPLVLAPTRAQRRRLAELHGARWLPPALDELDAPPARPTFARLAVRVDQPARALALARAFEAAGLCAPRGQGTRGRVTLLVPDALLTAPLELPAGWERRSCATPAERERALLEVGALAWCDPPRELAPEAALALRAARAGRALLAPPSAAYADLLENARTGILLEGAREEALARAWARLEAQPAELARLGAAARERAEPFVAAGWRARLEDWLFQLCDQRVLSPTAPVWERLPGDAEAPPLRQSA